MGRLAAVALGICLTIAGAAQAVAGGPETSESNDLAGGLAAVGVSIKDDLGAARPTVFVTVDRQKFLASIPMLQTMGMLNPDLNQTFINLHKDSMTDVFGAQAATMAIMDTYKNNPHANSVTFVAQMSESDDYGNPITRKMFSFDFTRALYKRINWDNFDTTNLTKVAPHFRISPWMRGRLAAETIGE